MSSRSISPLIPFVAVCALITPSARAATNLVYLGGYSFSVEECDTGYTISLCGREATAYGQNVYFLYSFYAVHSAQEEATSGVLGNDLFLLKDGAGAPREPSSAYILLNQTLFETAQLYVKFVYVGEFSGECYLRAKLTGEKQVRLNVGPEAADFYRLAVVTAREGADLRVAPAYDAAVLKELRPGDAVYLTGREEFYWPYPDLAWYECVSFQEAICGDARGWVVTYDNLKRLEFMEENAGEEPPASFFVSVETGGFAPLFPTGGRAAPPVVEEERRDER